ncbi:hypothetical protein [Promicromonospora sukumoe]
MSNPIHEATVREGAAADRRLAELGIARHRLEAALDAGDSAARQADKFSPVTAAGTYRWMSTVQMLRMGLATDGWLVSDDRNSPRIVNESGSVAVVAVRGTAGTGLLEGEPRTANPRGKATSRAVEINVQLEFAITALLADMAAEKNAGVKTWFLLYYRTESGELRAELSLPVEISEKGVVSTWIERIILPTRDFGAESVMPLDAGGNDDVDFVVAAL